MFLITESYISLPRKTKINYFVYFKYLKSFLYFSKLVEILWRILCTIFFPYFRVYYKVIYTFLLQTKANFECCESNELTESLSDVRKAHEKQKCFFNKLNVSPQLKFDDKSEKNDNISVSHKKLGISYSNYSISSNESAEKTTEFNKNSSNKVPSQLNIKENFSNISRKSMSNENLTCLSNFSGNIKEYEAYVGFKKKHVYNCESILENDVKSLSSCEHQSVSNLSSSQVFLLLLTNFVWFQFD